jgi:hypothetical protein
MLAAAAILLALAGSGAFAGGSSGGSSGSGAKPAVQVVPAADEQLQQSGPGTGMTHSGRHCNHDGQGGRSPQSAPQSQPPV